MWASIEFVHRGGSDDIYGHLSEAAAWTPRAGSSQEEIDEELWRRAQSCFADPAESEQEQRKQENRTLPAAYTFFGQFVTHDITFDTGLDPRTAHLPRRNRRTPALDLDSLYGSGPVDQPSLYELKDHEKFATPRIESGEFDLPRNNDDSVLHPSTDKNINLRRAAVIGDPRNDENILIAQMHLAFLRFHNAMVDGLRASEERFDNGPFGDGVFGEARKRTTWHYQWVLVQFLRKLCGDEIVDNALAGGPLRIARIRKPPPILPFEFTLAALRFGHSMIGPSYILNDELKDNAEPLRIPLFSDVGPDWEPRDRAAGLSLEGERVLPRDWSLQWDRFLDVGTGKTQWSQRINPKLAAPLEHLPLPGSARDRSLAYLTLQRGQKEGLPSGQSLAAELELSNPDLKKANDPLWLYILKEAEIETNGERLGRLGAALVGEVLISLLREDQRSFLSERGWTPTLPIHYVPKRDAKAVFDLADFLYHAGVPIEVANWKADRVLK